MIGETILWLMVILLYGGWIYRSVTKTTHTVTRSDDHSAFLIVLGWWTILGAHLLWPFSLADKLISQKANNEQN